MENFPKKLNPEELHELSDDKRAVRGALGGIQESSMPEKMREGLTEKHQNLLGALKEKSKGLIESYGGISSVKETLRSKEEFDVLATYFDEDAVRALKEHVETKEAYDTLIIKQIKENISTGTSSSVAQDILSGYQEEALREEDALRIIAENEPVLERAHTLLSYKEALSKEGHICPLPSTVEYIRKIEDRMITGKPVFLHGATGTGKTSLARYAAKELTGKEAEMVYCSPQFREQQVWSTTGLKASEDGRGVETVVIYGPLARAIRDGKAIIFDEFTTLPKEQMAFIKSVFNKKIGDTVTVPGNGEIIAQEGFQMIFTANLKSEKNQERSDLPPEMASEFEQNNIEIGYASTEEMYDTMLARLMDKKGKITLSYEDLQDTLPRFVSAIKEVQIAYTGILPDDEAKKLGAMEANGKIQGLKKFVMSQRSIEAVIDRWNVEQARDKEANFRSFLDDALQTGILFKEYPETDRALVAKIFASKGFLKTKSESELGLKSGALKGLLAEGEYDETKKQTLSIKDVSELDPFHTRKSKAEEEAESFVKESKNEKGEELNLEQIKSTFTPFLTETFTKWYNKETAEKVEQKPAVIIPADIDWQTLKDDVDVAKFGEYTLNPDTMSINWENIPQEKIKTFDFKEFVGKPRAELAKHIVENYSDKYYIPGIEYWKYIIENPDKAREDLKDGRYYYFFGSLLRNQDGSTSVPCTDWFDSQFNRNARRLDYDWDSGNRVVLLEK